MKKPYQQILCSLLAVSLIFSSFGGRRARAAAVSQQQPADVSSFISSGEEKTYGQYLQEYAGASPADHTIAIAAADYQAGEGSLSVTEEGALHTGDDSTVTWRFQVLQTGLYEMTFDYYPTVSKGGSIERTILLDGEVPFQEASYVTFSRVYRDSGAFERDASGNDLRPTSEETPRWLSSTLQDSGGYIRGALKLYLTQGEHSLTLKAEKEELELREIRFSPGEEIISYEAYRRQYQAAAGDGGVLCLEAEQPLEKSSFTIAPQFDKASAATSPQDPVKIRYNTIGGSKWAHPGQWITWEVQIEREGLYRIASRYRQNTYAGGYVSRSLAIDGAYPFAEAQAIRFPYADKWKVAALGDGEQDYAFYLTPGRHTVTMSVVLGDMSDMIDTVDGILQQLNVDYRRILMLTGTSPDLYRDYGFASLIPDVLENMEQQADRLRQVIEQLGRETGAKGDYTVNLNKMVIILDKVKEDPENLSEVFQTFKENLASMGTWLQNARQQPLEFDRIYFVPQGQELPSSGDGVFQNIVFQVKAFFLSFLEDYQSMGTNITQEDRESNNLVTVWMSTGREQSQIVQQLADQYFTPDTGVKVNLQLVAASALLPSVLAGTGPDVSLSTPTSDPINYAVRGAVVDLTKFPDLDEVLTRFHKSALASFTFNGSVYALPETESFPMFFYRTDIFEELGLTPPKTWNEFYAAIPILQKQNMTVGFPVSNQTAATADVAAAAAATSANLLGLKIFLYQNGGTLYNDALTKSNMTENANVEAFQEMTDLFTLYNFPVQYDFANRFRSGEMPMGIQDYSMYNQLTVFAPEIKGLWAMAPLPGKLQADGTVNNTSPSGGLGVVMLRNAKSEDKAWSFMKWWTSEETQSRYAIELESVLGPAAKQPTANVKALQSMSWTAQEYHALSQQMENLTGTPEIPGGYYTARAIDFAFSATYIQKGKAVTALLDNVNAIDEEIARKRKEFGLDS